MKISNFLAFCAVAMLQWSCAHAAPKTSTSAKKPVVMKPIPAAKIPIGHYLPREISFDLPNVQSDPFDYLSTNVQVQVLADGKKVQIPAFFDGGTQWRARFTPMSSQMTFGEVTLNGAIVEVARRVSGVNGALPKTQTRPIGPGFVRIDPKMPTRFIFDNGARFFPIGHNVAWRNNKAPDIPNLIAKMSAHGENWTRVWMNHWDGKNLDWPQQNKLGELNLDVARRWDAIVYAAERNDVVFQMTLQHHGQYSTTVNPNWNENPYNAKLGGFLAVPDEFFTNEQAKSLTKRKLRYAVARWGYSPSLMAWELWNEVQFTDAARNKQWESIANWHSEMAAFLREQDPFKHLITTSSTGDLTPEVWRDMDYFQEHAYPSDLIVALGTEHGEKLNKPFFVGEFGPADLKDEDGKYLHAGLWASLFSNSSGAAQYWDWDAVEKNNLYPHYEGAAQWLKASKLAVQTNLRPMQPKMETDALGELSFGPGGAWGVASQSEFAVEPTGAPKGIGILPKYLQGQNHRAMNPKPLRFTVNFSRPGTFTVHFSQIAKAGAHLKLKVGEISVERDFPAMENDWNLSGEMERLTLKVPAGRQVISLENSGQDWAVIERFTLSNYAPTLTARALGNANFWAAWVFNRANALALAGYEGAATDGKITVSGLRAGRYRATWMNTLNGQTLHTQNLIIAAKKNAVLQSPPVTRDVAVFVAPIR